jgi:metal-dependent hydrolase (beta-lactamase superfamily II)
MTGIDRIHAIFGGFHLINAAPDIIEETIAELKAMEPDYIVPAHCAGFEAITGRCRNNSFSTRRERSMSGRVCDRP